MGKMQRNKGARTERELVAWLRDLGIRADRTSRGADVHQMGDIAGIPGWVIEVKWWKRPSPAVWMRQLDAEMAAAGVEDGVVIWRPPGRPRPAEWLAIVGEMTSQRPTPAVDTVSPVPATDWDSAIDILMWDEVVTLLSDGRRVAVMRLAWFLDALADDGDIDASCSPFSSINHERANRG